MIKIKDVRQKVFRIFVRDLPEATYRMNYRTEISESRVVEIRLNESWGDVCGRATAMVIVEISGSYPYMTNKYEEFIKAVES